MKNNLISNVYEVNVNKYIFLLINCQNLKDKLEALCENKLLIKNKKLNKKIIRLNLKLNENLFNLTIIHNVINLQNMGEELVLAK